MKNPPPCRIVLIALSERTPLNTKAPLDLKSIVFLNKVYKIAKAVLNEIGSITYCALCGTPLFCLPSSLIRNNTASCGTRKQYKNWSVFCAKCGNFYAETLRVCKSCPLTVTRKHVEDRIRYHNSLLFEEEFENNIQLEVWTLQYLLRQHYNTPKIKPSAETLSKYEYKAPPLKRG